MTTFLIGLLIAVFIILLIVLNYRDITEKIEGFGTDDKPFEPDNSEIQNNPFDNIDYIRPVFKLRK